MNDIQKLELELKSRGYSKKTIQSYMFQIKEFISKNPNYKNATNKELQKHIISRSIKEDHLTTNLHIAAIKFFYRNVLLQEINLNYLKRPKRIPEVLTREETIAILNQISNPKH